MSFSCLCELLLFLRTPGKQVFREQTPTLTEVSQPGQTGVYPTVGRLWSQPGGPRSRGVGVPAQRAGTLHVAWPPLGLSEGVSAEGGGRPGKQGIFAAGVS